MRVFIYLGCFIFIICSFCTSVRADAYGIAVLQGLDKVTAQVSTFSAPIGVYVDFGSLRIIARKCDKRPPEETPESAVFLDISEVKSDQPAITRYRGWMFASSPALAAMEHPVYDVWVLDCKMRLNPESSSKGSRP